MVLVVATTLTWSCGGGATDVPGDTAERDAFVGAYVDLRSAASISASTDLQDEVRDSILAAYDVTAQDLLDFVDTHGEDIEFMRDLWTELEALLSERLERDAGAEGNEG
jgi:hypothetical protein